MGSFQGEDQNQVAPRAALTLSLSLTLTLTLTLILALCSPRSAGTRPAAPRSASRDIKVQCAPDTAPGVLTLHTSITVMSPRPTTADKYSDVGGDGGFASDFASDYPKVFILPLMPEFNENLLRCDIPWQSKPGDLQMFSQISPELPFGKVQKFSFAWKQLQYGISLR